LKGSISFQLFSRQARGDPSRPQEKKIPIWKKEHVFYNGGGIPIYQCHDKEIPPQGEYVLPSVLSLLPSVTKTKGKTERAFQVAVTPPAWPLPHMTCQS
jgi:hypothetical protein